MSSYRSNYKRILSINTAQSEVKAIKCSNRLSYILSLFSRKKTFGSKKVYNT